MADDFNHRSSPSLDRDRDKPKASNAYFDFVIAERPVYIPNSGPPMQPISLLPPHDKTMLIQAEIQLDADPGRWAYQVYEPDKPGLRFSVRPEKILDWVSARTLENWELDKPAREERERKELEREIAAEAATMRQKWKVNKSKEKVLSRATNGTSKNDKKRRLSMNAPISAGPSRKRRAAVEEESVFASPTTTYRKGTRKGPSLTTPAKNINLDSETPDDYDEDEDDDEDYNATDVAIARQLNGAVGRSFGPFKGTTPQGLRAPAPSTAAASSSKQPSKSPLFSPRFAQASTSSIEFRRELEKLEVEKETPRVNGERSIEEKYPNWVRSPTMFETSSKPNVTLAHIRNPFLKKSEVEEEEEEEGEELDSASDDVVMEEAEKDEVEEEYEVEEILREEAGLIHDDGTLSAKFLIKWVGYGHDANTWEPEEHLSPDLIDEFREKRRRERRSRSGTIRPPSNNRAISTSNRNSTPNRNIKSESRTPRSSGLQSEIPASTKAAILKAPEEGLFVSSDDNDDQYAAESQNSKGNKMSKSMGNPAGKTRNMPVVIDTDTDSDEF